MDESPYLSQGSRGTIAAAAQLARAFKGHLVVVSLDREEWTFDGSVRADTISFHLKGWKDECPLAAQVKHRGHRHSMLKKRRFVLADNECDDYDMVVNKVSEKDDASLLFTGHGTQFWLSMVCTLQGDDVALSIADLADDIEGTFVVLSTDMVEQSYVDANKLAKFMGCSFAFVE
eukprot:3289048-Pyramimonas_sp.AAC.2